VYSLTKVKITDVTTPVLVLGSNHYGSLSVTRSLGRLGVNVYVHEPRVRSPVFYSKYCRGKFVWRDAETSPRKTVNCLLEIAEKIGNRSILVPYSDENANTLSGYANELKEHFIFPSVSPEIIRSVSNKKEMYFLAKKNDIPTPEAYFPESRLDLEGYIKHTNFPIMLKTICSHSRPGGGTNFLVKTKEQLFSLYDKLENFSNPNFFVQEYIPGSDESSWMFNGYFNEQSECLFGMTGRKICQSPPVAGVTSFGVCERNDDVLEISKRFITSLGYKGMIDIDYRYDKRDCKYKVIDVNPRIGLTFRLFVGDNGLDVMRAAYLDLTGQPVPSSQIVNGRKYLVEDSYLFSQFPYKNRTNFFRGLQETAYFASDDLDPFFIMCLRTASSIFKRF
jgi:D-aspartate ligase